MPAPATPRPEHQPIGAVDDLPTVIGKITAVLRSVDGGQ
jgi:hypothetical protein